MARASEQPRAQSEPVSRGGSMSSASVSPPQEPLRHTSSTAPPTLPSSDATSLLHIDEESESSLPKHAPDPTERTESVAAASVADSAEAAQQPAIRWRILRTSTDSLAPPSIHQPPESSLPASTIADSAQPTDQHPSLPVPSAVSPTHAAQPSSRVRLMIVDDSEVNIKLVRRLIALV